MKRRIRRTLLACWVGLSGTAIGAAADTGTAGPGRALEAEGAPEIAQASQAEEDRKVSARTADAEKTGGVPQTGAMEATEAEEVAEPEETAERAEAAESKKVAESEEIAESEEAAAAREAGGAEEEPDDNAGGGIFSSILKWFQGRNGETAPDRAQAHQAGTAPSVNRQFGRRSSSAPQGPQDEGNDITPSHVYQATANLIAEIEVLRTAMNIVDPPRKADLQEDRTPIHAYTKSLEVMSKTAFVQRRLGMIPVEVGHIPAGNVTLKDLHRNVQAVVEELHRVKRQLVIEDEIQPTPFAGGKTPALVYKTLGDASYLLDGLVGRPTTSNEVHMHMLRVHDEMASIAAALGATLESEPPRAEGARESKDVAQQILRATYKTINLQSRLGMDASGVPTMTLEEVTPTEVFDATSFLLAELVRIQVHLNIQSSPPERRASRNKQAADVFVQALLVIRNLDIMTRAAGDSGQGR